MITNQYYTTRRNTYYNPILVLEELAALNGESNANSIGAPSVSNMNGVGLRLTTRPVIGQLIVITLNTATYDDYGVGFIYTAPPIVSNISNSFTKFDLAAVGSDLDAGVEWGTLGWGSQSSIWYRVVDNYDLIAWDAGQGYCGWAYNSPTGWATHMMTVTHLSRGTYWTTPIAPLDVNSNLTSAYGNSTIKPATSNAMVAGGTGVNVEAGGFVIASCSRPNSTVAASVNNSFTLTSQTRTVAPNNRYFTARRTFTENASAQNTTFSFSESKFTSTAIAAFNP